MGYQRGSEEFYKGPTGGYNSDTLALLQNQQRRMLDQQDKSGQMYAEGVEGAGRELGNTIASIPGAYMQGAKFKQGSQEHQAKMDQAARQGRLTEEQITGAGLENQSMTQKNRMEAAKNDYMLGTEEGQTAPRINTMLSAEIKQPGLANQATEAGIGQTKAATALTNRQLSTIGTTEQDRRIDQAAQLYASGNDALVAGMRLTPKEQALAMGKSKTIRSQAEASQNLLGSNSITAPAQVEELRNVQGDIVKLKQLIAAKDEYKNATTFSGNEGKAQRKMDQILASLGEQPTSGWYSPGAYDLSGGMVPVKANSRHDQAQQAIERLQSSLQAKVAALKETSAQYPDAARTIAQLEQSLQSLSAEAQQAKDEQDFLGGQGRYVPKKAPGGVMKAGGAGGKPSPLFHRGGR